VGVVNPGPQISTPYADRSGPGADMARLTARVRAGPAFQRRCSAS
jgi:hypothetical protein